MKGIAVKTLDNAGGQQLAGGQTFVSVEGALVVLLGDPVTPHGEGLHSAPTMAEASPWVTINGTPVCREGHRATCGHPTTGRPWVTLQDGGAS